MRFRVSDQVCCKAAGTSAVSSLVMRKRRKMLSPPCSSPNFFRMGCKLCFKISRCTSWLPSSKLYNLLGPTPSSAKLGTTVQNSPFFPSPRNAPGETTKTNGSRKSSGIAPRLYGIRTGVNSMACAPTASSLDVLYGKASKCARWVRAHSCVGPSPLSGELQYASDAGPGGFFARK
jgi:hypothetical protein